jgi:hypothetical protein
MFDPITLMVIASTAATVGKAVFQSQAAEERKQSINLQAEQELLQYQQRTLSNYDVLQKVLATQEAQATTRGVKLGGGSFEAIQRNTFNVAGRKQENIEAEHNIFQHNVKAERMNVNNTLFGQLFGDVAEETMDFAALKEKLPTKATKTKAA